VDRHTTVVLTEAELVECREAIIDAGAFCFDVETRGFVDRHPDVLDMIEEEWQAKALTLKSTSDSVRERSRQHIVDRWQDGLGLDTLRNEVFWIGLAVEGRSWAIPMGHPNGEVLVPEERGDGTTVPPEGYRAILKSGKESKAKAKYLIPAEFTPAPEQLTQEQVFGALEEIFFDPTLVKVAHNVKFDTKSIAKYYGGQIPEGPWVDTMILQHILNENLQSYQLMKLCEHNFQGYNPYHRFGKIGDRIQTEPFSKASHYVHLDVRWTWLLYKRLWRYIENDGMTEARDRDLSNLPVLAQMELNGIHVAERQMGKLGKELEEEKNTLLLEMMGHAFPGFNPDANKDKQWLLFNKKRKPKDWPEDEEFVPGLGLPVKKYTAGGQPSVDRTVLEQLEGKHPMVDLLLRWQNVSKIKGTYVDGLRPQLNHGRLHPQFHLHRTDTGRLSSSNPNLQNIPRDGNVRGLFVAGPGEKLIVADYDQIELRVMAMFSGDKNLTDIFVNGTKDIHTATACLVLGREYGTVDDGVLTGEERTLYGKMPNFLMGYGGTAKLLAGKLDIPIDQAEEIVKGYKQAYAGMFQWRQKMIDKAHSKGYVVTAGGRRRRLSDLTSTNQYDVFRAERQAVNAIVQGTASEICKDAMVRVHNILDYPACKMLVQLHDELVVSVPEEEASDWLPKLEAGMGDGMVIDGIPLRVSGNAAHSWYDAK
jgi:DNA polymerase I-like protein with 3'-5' exonuclease and polymerase domains